MGSSKLEIVLIVLIVLMIPVVVSADLQSPEDQYQRPLISERNSRINYDRSSNGHEIGPRKFHEPIPWTHSGVFNTDTSKDGLLNLNWEIGVFGSGIGATGFQIARHASPYPEIICGGSTGTFSANDFWYIVSYDPAIGGYSQTWISDAIESESIFKILHEDLYRIGLDEILIIELSGAVKRYDRQSRTQTGSFQIIFSNVQDAVAGDFNGDTSPDLFVINNDDLHVYDIVSGDLLYSQEFGGKALGIGQMDTDPGLELAVVSSDIGIIWDLSSSQQEWEFPPGNRDIIAVDDIDNDGMDELLTIMDYSQITAFDVDTGVLKWQTNGFEVDALHTGVTENGGNRCVFYGEGQWGEIHCLDGITGNELWAIDNPEHGVTDINLADVDSDGVIELLWGAGYSSTGEDHLYIVNPATEMFEWENFHLDPPFPAFDTGDLDNDNVTEIAVCSFESRSGYDNGVLMVYNGETHELELMNNAVPDGTVWVGMRDLIIDNLDPTTPELEYLMATAAIYDAKMWGYSYPAQDLLWSTPQYNGTYFNSAEVADFDADGTLEVAGIVGVKHTGAEGVFLHVFNAETGIHEWSSSCLATGFQGGLGVASGDIDNDSIIEIGVIVSNQKFIIFNGQNSMTEYELSGPIFSSIHFTDINPSQPGIEILLGTSTGELHVYDGINKELLWTSSVGDSSIRAITCININEEENPEILVAIDGFLKVLDSTGAMLWSSLSLGDDAGFYGNIAAADVDKDGAIDVFISGSTRFYHFESSYHSAVPTPTPTPVATSTPSSDCTEWGCQVLMPANNFQAGDLCYCHVNLCNPSTTMHHEIPVFVILDVMGTLLFAPGFTEMDHYTLNLPPGLSLIEVIPEFYWPDGAGSASGLNWYAGMTNQEMNEILGSIGSYMFSYN